MDESIDTSYDRAAAALREAKALLITAGAGIGVDTASVGLARCNTTVTINDDW